MSKLGIEVQVPKVPIPRSPGDAPDNDDDGPHFIQSAMYVFACALHMAFEAELT